MQQKTLRTYTKKELRNMYDVSHTTWRSWMKKIEDKLPASRSHIYTINEVKIIFEHLGQP